MVFFGVLLMLKSITGSSTRAASPAPAVTNLASTYPVSQFVQLSGLLAYAPGRMGEHDVISILVT